MTEKNTHFMVLFEERNLTKWTIGTTASEKNFMCLVARSKIQLKISEKNTGILTLKWFSSWRKFIPTSETSIMNLNLNHF